MAGAQEREAAVSGMFYPQTKKELSETLDVLFEGIKEEKNGKALIVPHAGYVYSGRTAAIGYSSLEKGFDCFVFLGPNHTGLGEKLSVSSLDWKTPLGTVKRDERMGDAIVKETSAVYDNTAHQEEHSIEVQLPFMQRLYPKASMVALTMMGEEQAELKALGEALAGIVKTEASRGRKIGLIASSDFSHYVPKDYAEKHDQEALREIEALDPGAYTKKARDHSLTICGHDPIISLLYAVKTLNYKGKVLKYCTSFLATGTEPVVGYSAVKFY